MQSWPPARLLGVIFLGYCIITYQKRVEQLKHRLLQNAKIQEWEPLTVTKIV